MKDSKAEGALCAHFPPPKGKRHGYRPWLRFVCGLVGHDPWYSATIKGWDGLMMAYWMNCWRCGKELDSFHPEAFTQGTAPQAPSKL